MEKRSGKLVGNPSRTPPGVWFSAYLPWAAGAKGPPFSEGGGCGAGTTPGNGSVGSLGGVSDENAPPAKAVRFEGLR